MKMLENKAVKRVVGIWLTMQLTFAMTTVAFAATNYGENAARWGADQLFWIVVVITLAVMANQAMRRSITGCLGSLAIGGMVAYFCKAPEKIITIGEVIGNTVFGG